MRKYVFICYFTNSPGIILQINLLSIYMNCGNAFKEYIITVIIMHYQFTWSAWKVHINEKEHK